MVGTAPANAVAATRGTEGGSPFGPMSAVQRTRAASTTAITLAAAVRTGPRGRSRATRMAPPIKTPARTMGRAEVPGTDVDRASAARASSETDATVAPTRSRSRFRSAASGSGRKASPRADA